MPRSTLLLKRHILTPFAVPAGLAATVRCVLLMHAYAAALQSTHGLTVGPRITKELWPVVEQVLHFLCFRKPPMPSTLVRTPQIDTCLRLTNKSALPQSM